MEKLKLETSKTELVLVGQFEPNAVMPEQLAALDGITKSESKAASLSGLVQDQFVEYSLDWCNIQVVGNRFVIQTSKVPYIRVADLALKVLREGMKSPTVTMLGINRHFEYLYPDVLSRDQLGLRLSAPAAWGEWGRKIEADMQLPIDRNKHGGLMNITMRQMSPDDREAGWIDVSVSPSLSGDFGVIIRVNDHYQSDPKRDTDILDSHVRDAAKTARLLETLGANFDQSLKRSDAIAQGIISL